MKKIICIFISVIIAVAFAVSAFAGGGTVDVSINVTYRQSDARSMLALVNELRNGNGGRDAWYMNSTNTEKVYVGGLSDLQWDYELEKLAMIRAAELALRYDHERPDGTQCFTIYSEAGISYGYSAGENIAYGYRTVQSMFDGWAEENEPYQYQGHRRNMLGEGFTSVAVACVEYNGRAFWAMELCGKVNSADPTPANDSLTSVTLRSLPQYAPAVPDTTAPDTAPIVPDTEPDTAPAVPDTEPDTAPVVPDTEPDTAPIVPDTEPIVPDTGNRPDTDPDGFNPYDVNGDGYVNSKDLARLMKYIAGEKVEVVSADVNSDGAVNSKDLARLMRYMAG